MSKRIPKERIVYNNYDLYVDYPDDELIAMAKELEWIAEDDEPSDDQLWQWRHQEDEENWEIEKAELSKFFKDKTVGFFGEVGLWHGVYKAGRIGEFWDLFDSAIQDCDYIKLYDENGHLHLTCSHHDGTHHFEIKIITDKGSDYLKNWEYDNSKRTPQYVHTQIYNRYSTLPRFVEKVYGCKPCEYEPQSKAGFTRQLNNKAKSFYS